MRKPIASRKIETLAKELHEIGVARRRELEGYTDGKTWEWHMKRYPTQYGAWLAIAEYVDANFNRKKARAK